MITLSHIRLTCQDEMRIFSHMAIGWWPRQQHVLIRNDMTMGL